MGFTRYPPLSKPVAPPVGGGGTVTFPLVAPPGSAGNESYAFTTGGGLHGTSSGGLGLSVGGFDAISIAANGNTAIAKALEVSGVANLLGGVTTPSITASAASIQGNASISGGLGVGGSAQITGDLSARKITASADLSAASLSTPGPIAGASLSITGKGTFGSLEVKGTFKASSIASDGPLYFPTTSTNLPGLALFDQQSTGIFGAIGTLGFTVAGQVVASFDAQQRANFNGALTAASLQAPSLNTDSLTVTQTATMAALTVTGLTVNGNSHLTGDLLVDGTTRLANLAIDHISTDHDLTVGGNALVKGTFQANGAATLAGGLSVQGPTSLQGFSSGRATVSDLRILGGSPSHPPVLKEPIPNQPGTTDYVVVLSPDGDLALSGNFLVLGTSHLTGAVTLDNALSGPTATFSGALNAATAVLSGSLTATKAVLGGATFSAYAGNPEGQVSGNLGDEVVNTQTGDHYIKLSGSGTANGWAKTSTSASSLTFPLQAPDSAASAGPSYAFVSSAGDGLGSPGAGTVYLAVGNVAALTIGSGQAATFSGTVTAPAFSGQTVQVGSGGLTVQGSTQLAGLTAGTTTLGALTAQGTTLASLLVQGTSTLTGDATLQGNAQVAGALGVVGAISSQASVQAPLHLVGLQQLTSGNGNPNGQVVGAPGDLRADRQGGAVWIKITGTGNTGWARLTTSADGTTFPLLAPDGQLSSPSYGFNNQTGLTVVSGKLTGVIGGQAGWSLGTDLSLALAGALSVAGTSALAALTATQAQVTGAVGAGSLNVSGASSLASVSAQAVTATGLTVNGSASVTGSLTGSTGTFSGLVAAASLKSGPSTWTAATTAPAAGSGSAGDFATIADASADHPFQVRVGSTWKQVSFVGDASPSQFPLRGPADSAAAPNFAPSASYPGTGIFSAGANMLGFAANGVSAGTVDASGNWIFAKNISAQVATFTQATINGTFSATGNASLGGTLQVTGAVTLASTLNSGDFTSSGKVTAAQGAFSGALTSQSLTTTADVTVGGNLIVNGNTQYNGIARSGYINTGDGTVSAPAWAFTSEQGLGVYRQASGVLSFAVGGNNSFSLAATLATFAGAVRVGGNNAGLTSPAANQLALQTAGVAALTVDATQNISLAAKLTVAGLTTGTTSIWTTSATTPLLGLTEGTAPTTGTTGQLFVKSTDHNLYFVSSTGTTTQLTPQNPVSFPLLAPAGTAAAPSYGISSANTGIFSVNLATNITTTVSVAQAGRVIANFYGYTTSGTGAATPLSAITLGDATTTTVGIVSMAPITPNGNVGGYGGSLHIFPNQGAGKSLWLNEGTGANSSSWGTVYSSLTPQIAGSAGTAAAPYHSFAGGLGSGLWAGTDAFSNPTVNLSVAGVNVALFKQVTQNSLPIFALGLGNVASSTVNGGILVSGQSPSGIGAFPSQLYQDTRGGVGCLWLYEGTTNGSTAWAKVLTTSSPVSPSFPILAPNGSVSAPSYSYANFPTTGVTYVNDAGGGNIPAIAAVAAGKVIAYFDSQVVNSVTVYNMVMGDPTINASPYPAGIRAYGATASGNLIGAVGQLTINNVGGAGTILAVKESGVGTSSGWSFLYTQGTSQIAGAAGSLAAPYHSFSNSLSSGFFYNASTGITTSVAGNQVFNIGTVGAVFSNSWVQFPAGSLSQPSITFSNNTTTGFYSGTNFSTPTVYVTLGGSFWGGFNRYGSGSNVGYGIDIGPSGNFSNGGFIVTNALPTNNATTSPGTLVCVQNGTLWYKESGSQTQTGYMQVLTTSTQIAAAKLLYQSAAPATIASVGQIYTLTDGNLYYINAAGTVKNLSAPTLTQPATNTAPGASYTTVAGDANRTFVNTSTTQSAITLYTVPSGTDYQVTFVVGNTGGFSITAPSSQVIYVGVTPTTASNISSATQGSTITLSNPGGLGTWYATLVTGAWTTN